MVKTIEQMGGFVLLFVYFFVHILTIDDNSFIENYYFVANGVHEAFLHEATICFHVNKTIVAYEQCLKKNLYLQLERSFFGNEPCLFS
jgi:hypothetical protein